MGIMELLPIRACHIGLRESPAEIHYNEGDLCAPPEIDNQRAHPALEKDRWLQSLHGLLGSFLSFGEGDEDVLERVVTDYGVLERKVLLEGEDSGEEVAPQ